jgi:hypothetical protein
MRSPKARRLRENRQRGDSVPLPLAHAARLNPLQPSIDRELPGAALLRTGPQLDGVPAALESSALLYEAAISNFPPSNATAARFPGAQGLRLRAAGK